MKLYRTARGVILEHDQSFFRLNDDWDVLIAHANLHAHLRAAAARLPAQDSLDDRVLAPIGNQEVWAAGVTYYRTAGRVRGPGEPVRIRRDAKWSVPEPEIALCINPRAQIIGYTIGNDMSSRDIEGENPLYLPQAKIYDGACALGPALLVTEEPLPPDTPIELRITRGSDTVYEGRTTFSQMRRKPVELVEFLYRETSFPHGCILLTGTGVVPGDDFRLQTGDEVRIHVPAIGTLNNIVD